MACRVAARWLQAGINQELDIMIRLQTLEGAAGVRHRAWGDKGRRGFKLVREHFSPDEVQVLEKMGWLDTGDTGTYVRLLKKLTHYVGSLARGIGASRLDPREVIDSALFRLPTKLDDKKFKTETGDIDTTKLIEPKFWKAGVNLKNEILSGRRTPQKAIDLVGKWLKLNLISLYNKIKDKMILQKKQEKDAPPQGVETAPDVKLDSGRLEQYFIDWMGLPNDPIGKALRKVMLESWVGWKGEEAMQLWLRDLVRGRDLSQGQMAQEYAGVGKGTWTQNYLQRGWALFARRLKGETKLFNSIQLRLITHYGFTEDEVPEPKEITDAITSKPMPKSLLKSADWLASYPATPPF
jgi:hypothetical protein